MIKYKQKLDSLLNKSRENKIIRVRLEELTFHPELEQAFKIDPSVAERIKDDIRHHGDNTKAHPIHVFKLNGKWCVSDGHTRVSVLKSLGHKYVWAQVHNFTSVQDALRYSMAEQFNRRNETDADLLSRYLVLREQEIDGKKLTADELANKLNKSRRHIFKLQTVFSKSSPQQLDAIKEGTATINSVYQEIKKHEVEESGEVAKADVVEQEEIVEEKLPVSTQKPSKTPKPTYQDGYSAGIRYALDALTNGKTLNDLRAELDA